MSGRNLMKSWEGMPSDRKYSFKTGSQYYVWLQ